MSFENETDLIPQLCSQMQMTAIRFPYSGVIWLILHLVQISRAAKEHRRINKLWCI